MYALSNYDLLQNITCRVASQENPALFGAGEGKCGEGEEWHSTAAKLPVEFGLLTASSPHGDLLRGMQP